MASYYVAKGGDDGDPGTIGEPWQTIAKVNASSFSGGDHIYFNRGDIWREKLKVPSSGDPGNPIVFGAYGSGADPLILGSFDKSDNADWADQGGNIWRTVATFASDVGNPIFDNEDSCGERMEALVDCIAQGDFFYNSGDSKVYVYSVGNPGTFYSQIEVAVKGGPSDTDFPWSILSIVDHSYITFQDLDLRYSGWLGLMTYPEYDTPSHIITEWCNFSFIGGSQGGGVRAGNGIEYWEDASDLIVRYCTFNQIYDAAISPQGTTGGGFNNLDFYYNRISKCGYSFELWHQAAESKYTNLHIYNNTCTEAGGEWSKNQRWGDTSESAHIKMFNSNFTPGVETEFSWVIKNNIFYLSTDFLVDFNYWLTDTQRAAITLGNNCYYQDDGDEVLVHWHHPSDGEILYTANGTGGDKTFAEWKTDHGKDADSINDNPDFVSASDLHLTDVSPCIDAGALVGLFLDLDGTTVPINVIPDIGCYEYIEASGEWIEIACLPPNVTYYKDTGVAAGLHTYRVRAVQGTASADLLDECFEASAGYDEAGWSENEGAGSTVDEDCTEIARPIASSSQCMKIQKVAPNYNTGFSISLGSDKPITYTSFYIRIAATGLGDASSMKIMELYDSAWDTAAYVRLYRDGTDYQFLYYIYEGGALVNLGDGGNINFDQWYKIGIKYDVTNHAYEIKQDEVSIYSGTIDETHRAGIQIVYGGNIDDSVTLTAYYDHLQISSTGWSSFSEYSNEASGSMFLVPGAPADLLLDCNLIADPSFEMWNSATDPRDWVDSATGGADVNRESAGPIEGTYYLRLDGGDSDYEVSVTSTGFTLEPYKRYHLEFWARVATPGDCPLVYIYSPEPILALQTDGSWQYGSYNHCFEITEVPWRKYSLDFNGPGAEAECFLQFFADATHYITGSSLYVDAVRLYEVGSLDFCRDTQIRLKWTASPTAVGYKVERSTDGIAFSEIAKLPTTVCSYRDGGRSASTQYWYNVRAYNSAGNGAYCDAQSIVTSAAYEPTRFEEHIARPSAEVVYLLEVNPLMELKGWALESGGTYSYELQLDDRGITFDYLYENGELMTEVGTVSEVEGTAGTWFYDYYAEVIYCHPSGDDDPSNYLITGSFWLYFCNWAKTTTALADGTLYVLDKGTSFNGNYYYPFLSKAGIPDISQEIQPYYEGNFTVSSGSVNLKNPVVNGNPFFDKLFKRYIWINRKARILAGGPDFYYGEYCCIHTGTVNAVTIDDRDFVLDLRDYRDGIHRILPEDKYTASEFPQMDEQLADKIRPFGFGRVYGQANCIDTINKVFEAHNGRISTVYAVYKNDTGAALTEDSDYYVDYQRGRIILDRDYSFDTDKDFIVVDFDACTDAALDTVSNGAEVFKYILNNSLGLADTEIDLDSVWEARDARPDSLKLFLYGERSSDAVIKNIEHTIRAYSYQDSRGRLGLKVATTTAPSNIKYIDGSQIFNFRMSKSLESIFGEVMVHYAEYPLTARYSWVMKTVSSSVWRYGTRRRLEIYTCLGTSADAEDLGDEITALLDKEYISFTVPRVLYDCYPGDLIYLTRSRFYSLSGTANNQLLRIISISKQIASGKTSIKAEVV